jgi:dynein assembly factor 1
MEMTKKALRKICQANDQYITPELNDVLYLQHKGFSRIENLEEYKGCKCLYLESNGLHEIEGLEALVEMRSLYLNNNLIYEIKGLETMSRLTVVNLANNCLSRIENIGGTANPNIQTLNLKSNRIASVEDCKGLLDCPHIGVLDISDNKISDEKVMSIFEQLTELKVLYFKGNPIQKEMKSYRKTMICRLPNLVYLDDRPIFEDERLRAEAWGRGGVQAEREERKRYTAEKERKERERHDAFQKMVNEARAKRREELGLPPQDPNDRWKDSEPEETSDQDTDIKSDSDDEPCPDLEYSEEVKVHDSKRSGMKIKEVHEIPEVRPDSKEMKQVTQAWGESKVHAVAPPRPTKASGGSGSMFITEVSDDEGDFFGSAMDGKYEENQAPAVLIEELEDMD